MKYLMCISTSFTPWWVLSVVEPAMFKWPVTPKHVICRKCCMIGGFSAFIIIKTLTWPRRAVSLFELPQVTSFCKEKTHDKWNTWGVILLQFCHNFGGVTNLQNVQKTNANLGSAGFNHCSARPPFSVNSRWFSYMATCVVKTALQLLLYGKASLQMFVYVVHMEQ